jgi:hypothetical protein
MLGVSLKVIHPTLINYKSFLLKCQESINIMAEFLAWYSYVRSDLYQFRKGGFSGGNERGAI